MKKLTGIDLLRALCAEFGPSGCEGMWPILSRASCGTSVQRGATAWEI